MVAFAQDDTVQPHELLRHSLSVLRADKVWLLFCGWERWVVVLKAKRFNFIVLCILGEMVSLIGHWLSGTAAKFLMSGACSPKRLSMGWLFSLIFFENIFFESSLVLHFDN